MIKQYFNIGGVNTYINPLLSDGQMVHCVNMETFPYGAKTKRPGYVAFNSSLGTTVQSLWSYTQDSGTTLFTYAKSGSVVYYSPQGTGAWAVAGNGTVDQNAHMGAAILNNTLIVGDGVGSTRHTTNGTAFTNTTLAPPGEFFEQFQNRVYIMGTNSDLFYSTTNDATNWNTSGTSDSNSLKIPGAGRGGKIFKSLNQLVATKTSGLMYRWDGFSLRDMATKLGPSSPYSVAQSEDYWFFMNQLGHYGFNGDKPQLLSNPVQRQIYNNSGSAIAGTQFPLITSEVHKYDYLASIGTVTDNFTNRTIPDAILKYDYQKNEYLNWRFANRPTAMHSYKDVNNNQQLLFGDNTGQTYMFGGTATTDNGKPISTEMLFVFNADTPEYDKHWRWYRFFFNPGCQAQAQIYFTNDFQKFDSKSPVEITDCTAGVVEGKFPGKPRSKFMVLRIYESGRAARYSYYGCSLDYTVISQT